MKVYIGKRNQNQTDKYIIENIKSLDNVKQYMSHTVYGKNNEQRIEVLKKLVKHPNLELRRRHYAN